jgi:hypothetical protein
VLAQIELVAGGRHEIEQHDADGKRLVPRNLAPELVEAGKQKADVAGRVEADLVPKAARIADPSQVKAAAAAIVVAAPNRSPV